MDLSISTRNRVAIRWKAYEKRWFLAGALILTALVSGVLPNRASAQAPSEIDEYTVKAAFLYNFSQYIKWPNHAFADEESPFVIGVFGEVPPELDRALQLCQKKKRVQKRPIEIRYFVDPEQVAGCHILFVRNTQQAEKVDEVMQECGDQSVLVVGEDEEFLQRGGSINFTNDQQKVSFQLALGMTKSHNLQPDAKLLRVARVVE